MLVELSVPFYPGMPRYDDSIPDVVYTERTRMYNGEPNNTTSVKFFLHSGTHVDAPFHFDAEGRTIDEIPIEDFCYRSVVLVKLDHMKEKLIRRADLENVPNIDTADLLLLYTGYCKWINDTEKYNKGFPGLDYEAACFLRREVPNLKAIGTDTISIESDDGTNLFPVHHELLDEATRQERSLLIFENLDLSKAVNKDIGLVTAYPLRFIGLDASPVMMVAEV